MKEWHRFEIFGMNGRMEGIIRIKLSSIYAYEDAGFKSKIYFGNQIKQTSLTIDKLEELLGVKTTNN